jgi:hypothetical protein
MVTPVSSSISVATIRNRSHPRGVTEWTKLVGDMANGAAAFGVAVQELLGQTEDRRVPADVDGGDQAAQIDRYGLR